MENRRDFLRKSSMAASMLMFIPRFLVPVKKQLLPPILSSKRKALDHMVQTSSDENMLFSRSSLASYYNSSGLLTYSGENMLTYSEDFRNASWVTAGSSLTISPDIVAPDGSFTTGILQEDLQKSEHRICRSLSVEQGTTYTISLFLKAGTCAKVRVSFMNKASYKKGNPSFIFNLLDGAITSPSVNVLYSTVTNAGDGWWRVSVTGTPDLKPISGFQIFMMTDKGTINYRGNNRNIYVWGGQFESGLKVTSYNSTSDQPGSVIRYNYNPESTALIGFLVEPKATNLLVYSENLDNPEAWLLVNTVAIKSEVFAPDGVSKSIKLLEDASFNLHYIRPLTLQQTTIGQIYNFSVFIRPGERKWVYLSINDSSVHFDLNERSVSRSVNPLFLNTDTEFVGNGWVRCSASIIASASEMEFAIGVEPDDNDRNYAGNESFGIYVWGAQLETGLYASSYIPTLSKAYVRRDEICTLLAPETAQPYDIFIQRRNGGSWADDISDSYQIPFSRYEVEGAGFWDPGTTDEGKEQIAEELYPTEFINAGLTKDKVTVFANDYRIQSADQLWSINMAMNKSCQPHRFEIRSGDQWASDAGKDKERSELYMLNELPFDQDVWLSYAVKVYPGDPVTSQFCHIGQFHATEDSHDAASVPILTFRFNGEDDLSVTTCANVEDPLVVNATGEVRYVGKLTRGVWVRNVLRVRFSPTNAQLQWWENGQEKLNLANTGIGNTDEVGPYWKFGIYRTQSVETLTVEYANMELSLESLQSRIYNPLLII
ncbi:heparin lyase I family protein [Dyadobacter sp. NIV53]|uniref:phage head spike fiber domain-containing protein n=1 Tax=Dyadobacter sp. NIV53 TaxID=2861765 RepID=UPI001C887AA1|nr:heparin lyase I family protein [Dyadobacter sp. NIV53]